MTLSHAQIAEAFSRHEFARTYPYFAESIRWNVIGGEQLAGQEAVTQTCEQSAEFLAKVTTTFTKFRAVVGEDCVVIDSEAIYTDADQETSTVASCDLYDFTDGKLVGITSYTISLDESAEKS